MAYLRWGVAEDELAADDASADWSALPFTVGVLMPVEFGDFRLHAKGTVGVYPLKFNVALGSLDVSTDAESQLGFATEVGVEKSTGDLRLGVFFGFTHVNPLRFRDIFDPDELGKFEDDDLTIQWYTAGISLRFPIQD